jgi:hypothetical protein
MYHNFIRFIPALTDPLQMSPFLPTTVPDVPKALLFSALFHLHVRWKVANHARAVLGSASKKALWYFIRVWIGDGPPQSLFPWVNDPYRLNHGKLRFLR